LLECLFGLLLALGCFVVGLGAFVGVDIESHCLVLGFDLLFALGVVLILGQAPTTSNSKPKQLQRIPIPNNGFQYINNKHSQSTTTNMSNTKQNHPMSTSTPKTQQQPKTTKNTPTTKNKKQKKKQHQHQQKQNKNKNNKNT